MASIKDLMMEKRGVRTRPPNLRNGTEQRSCESCVHFNKGTCAKYGGYPVRPDQVSDSYTPRRS